MNEENKLLRKHYLDAKRGDLTSYAGLIGEEFSSKINKLSQIIGTSHELSVGAYKESLLRSCIKKFIPKKYNVGTGFIIRESSLGNIAGDNIDLINLKEHYVSHQLDIIVFDDNNYPPVFRDGDFVVLRPESVRSIIEVKGFIKKKSITETIKHYIELGRNWGEYTNYYERWGRDKLYTPKFLLMAWDIYIDPKGKPACDGKILRKTIINAYHKYLSDEELKLRNIPILNEAYIYNDCCVSACSYVNDKGLSGDGYSTSRGKFIRYNESGEPFLDKDLTVSRLIASINVSLETPFNQDFLYLDQSMSFNLFHHENFGITDWRTRKDVCL